MFLPITLTFAAACALINIWLAIRCSRIRMADKVLHGDAGNVLLARRMRAHANFAEFTPIVLILCGLIELAAGESLWLAIATLVYAVARIAHGFGMDADRPTIWRAGGAMLTLAVTIALTLTALAITYTATREVTAPPALTAQV